YQYIKNVFIDFSEDDDILDEAPLANLKIYPNPITGNTLNIQTETSGESLSYQISNLYGQILTQGILNSTQIDVNNLSSGAYILTLNGKTGKITKKFIK